jgi:hypothetical protein
LFCHTIKTTVENPESTEHLWKLLDIEFYQEPIKTITVFSSRPRKYSLVWWTVFTVSCVLVGVATFQKKYFD